jgi:hypothetical protein
MRHQCIHPTLFTCKECGHKDERNSVTSSDICVNELQSGGLTATGYMLTISFFTAKTGLLECSVLAIPPPPPPDYTFPCLYL